MYYNFYFLNKESQNIETELFWRNTQKYAYNFLGGF